MTDFELLTFAAKAAGIDGEYHAIGIYTPKNPADSYWNPLTNDGDALRLAFSLRIHTGYIGIPTTHTVWAGNGAVSAEEPYTGPEALRKAIVRAAAEIGKEIQ